MSAMPEPSAATAVAIPIPGGTIEAFSLPGGPGRPLVVLGGVEWGFRPLTGTEGVLRRRWARRTAARPVTILGRPLPDDPREADLLLHPRNSAAAVATAIGALGLTTPVAIEAESGGGRISLWLTLDHPELVARLVLSSVASETPHDSPMAHRLGRWILLAEARDWGDLFAGFARQLRPASAVHDPEVDAASRLQPHPATPERFIGELKATLDPSSFVTARLGEIEVPALVLAGALDQVVPVETTRMVADRIRGAQFAVDPECGHTVRTSFRGYDTLVEAFLAEGD